MHSLLQKLLLKKGIKSFEQLDNRMLPDGSPSEREIFEGYEKVLSKKELTLTDIKEFCLGQLKTVEEQWKNLDNDPKKNDRLIIQHVVYRTLVDLIDSPKVEREVLEKRLNDLI